MSVGGGQRTNRKRKQQQTAAAAARAVAAARGSKRDRSRMIIAIVVVVVLAGAVIGGVLYEQHKANVAAQTIIPSLTVAGSTKYPVSLDQQDATVLVGQPSAKVQVDLYEDFRCPICKDFEDTNWSNIEKQLEAGTIKVRYHMLNLLDNSNNPGNYSVMSANTALAVAQAEPGKFIDFHYSLYQKQPAEGVEGWSQAQLTSLANRLGVTGGQYDQVVNAQTYEKQINTNLQNAENDKNLWQTSSQGTAFGTPTVVANGKTINWQQDGTWLSDLVKAAS